MKKLMLSYFRLKNNDSMTTFFPSSFAVRLH